MKLWPFGKNRPPKPFTCVEYWLYLPKKKLPPQAAYMARMQRVNPFRPGDTPPTGPAEARLFSDIRLHINLILREKNAHVFRPDLFEDHVEPSVEALEGLAEAESFVKLQYLALERLRDDRHLRFMPYLVEAVAELTKAKVVFDVVQERLITMPELKAELEADELCDSPDFHCRSIWARTESGGCGMTRGLVKIGMPELETPESASDHRVLIIEVLNAAIAKLWETRELPEETMKVEAFGDEFDLHFQYAKKGPAKVRILRIHH